MTEEFTTRLRLQLHDAALREEQRGGFGRAAVAVRARPSLAFGSLAAAVAAGLVLIAGLWMVSSMSTETATPVVPGPRVVANVPLADGLGRSAWVAFGSVWLTDTNNGNILRVDPRTRRVTARIHVGSEATLAADDGSMWAIPIQAGVAPSPLMRIDPRTNRIVARIPMRSPDGTPFNGRFLAVGPRLWVIGGTSLLAIDTTRNRPVREVDLGGSFQLTDGHVSGNELWFTRGDRSITRFDGVTGRRLGRLPWRAPNGFMFPYADKLVRVDLKSVSLVDPTSGKPLWRTRIGSELNQADVVGGRLFVEGVNGAASRDSLWELDVHTGQVVGTATVPGFSVVNLFAVGGQVWMITADGHVIVVSG